MTEFTLGDLLAAAAQLPEEATVQELVDKMKETRPIPGQLTTGEKMEQHSFDGKKDEPCKTCGYTLSTRYVPNVRFIHPEADAANQH